MRSLRFLWLPAAVVLLLSSGCGYVHFGRLDQPITDTTLATDNANLRIEKKMLLEELAIARKEESALRALLDHPSPASGAASAELVAKLNDATRELATLRAGYARLQAEREKLQAGTATPPPSANDSTTVRLAAAEQIAALKTSMSSTEEKLAEALRNFTQLQEENNRLRVAIDEAHSENARLSGKVDQLTAQNNEARSALAQLNTEFLAQKEARAQAEQAAEALRAQLQAVTSTTAPAVTSLAAARESSASGAREIDATLHLAQPADDAKPSTAILSTSPEKLRAAAAKIDPPPAAPADAVAPAPVAPPPHTYVVQAGDTLEMIAERFYGRKDRWRVLYAANNAQLSGGRPLKPGMELEIPVE